MYEWSSKESLRKFTLRLKTQLFALPKQFHIHLCSLKQLKRACGNLQVNNHYEWRIFKKAEKPPTFCKTKSHR